MNPLLEHTYTLTADGRKALAARIGTSPAGLHQMAHAYRTQGKLSLTADLAARVEAATDGAVRREDCCVACGRCDLAKKARIRSDSAAGMTTQELMPANAEVSGGCAKKRRIPAGTKG